MKRPTAVVLCLLVLGVVCGPSLPAREAPPEQASGGARPVPEWGGSSPGLPWRRVAYGTGVVVALICGGVWVLKWLNGGSPLGQGRYMSVLESRAIGRRVQLFLVKVGPRVVLIACRGEHVARIGEFSEDELPPPPDDGGAPEGFGALLASALKGQGR